MENGTILPKPKYGYSLEHPTKGKLHYYVTLALAICLPLSYIVILLIQGPDYMHAWWEAAKLDGNKSPQILGMTPLTVIGIVLIISHSAIVKGWKRTLACIGCGAFIAWFYEFLGTNTVGGGVFGPYHYN